MTNRSIWRCPSCNRALGEVVDGTLYPFVEVLAISRGGAATVPCRCGAERKWVRGRYRGKRPLPARLLTLL